MGSILPAKTSCRLVLGAAALAALAFMGCGGGAGTVSGQVSYGGKPLPAGQISFLSQAGDKPVRIADITDGKYTVSNLPVGPAQIIVQTTAPSNPGPVPKDSPTPPPVAPGSYVPIPKKYGVPEQSGLTYEVKSGPQTHDIDLTP